MDSSQILVNTETHDFVTLCKAIYRDQTESALPLSAAQTGMWFAQTLSSPDSIFNLAEAIEIHGPIDPALFEAALRQVAMEADTVRVRFVDGIDGPRQIIAPSFDEDIPFIDVSAEADPQAAAKRWMMADLIRPTDPLAGPFWKSALLQLASDHFIWYHCGHHIIMDGFAGGLFARRVADIYAALVDGRPASKASEFGPLSLLIEEDIDYRQSVRFTRDRDYWMSRFADRPAPLSLAGRRSQNIGGLLRQTVNLSVDSVNELRRLARETGVSLPQIMIAAIAAYLYRVTGVEDLVIGFPVTARTNKRLRCVPGMVANAVPLRLAMAPDMSVTELLRQVGREVRQILRHQRYRYENLRRDLNLLATDQHLFTTVINIEPFDYDFRFAGYPVTPHNLSNGSADDLGIFVYDRGDEKGLTIDFDANPALYSAEELAGHQQRFLRLVATIMRDPCKLIGRIDILDPEERRRILIDWNATTADYPRDRCIHELFEAQARNMPDAVAVVFEGRHLTYTEINAKANRLAHHLRGLGGGPEARVAICLERSFEMVVGLLAVLKAGASYVPLDPDYPEERLAFILADSAPLVLLTQGDLVMDKGSLRSIPNLPVIDTDGEEQWAHRPTHNLDPAEIGLTSTHLAYIIYTSGSTGWPKGVMVPHAALCNHTLSVQAAFPLKRSDRFLQKTSIGFDAAVWEFFNPLCFGAVLILAPPKWQEDVRSLLSAIQEYEITTLQVVPSLLRLLLDLDGGGALCVLKRIFCGGEALPPALVQQCSRRLEAELINLYGPTETCIDASFWVCPRNFDGAITPIGRPIANARVYLLDDTLKPVPIGVPGELYLGGAGLARGYMGRPDLTAERFMPDPFGKSGARLYRTGDLGRWLPDGTIEYLGRNDFQVKLRGFRIELGEIEVQLAGYPGVRETVVLAQENGAGDPCLVAYYTADKALSPAELRFHLSEHLPEYMVPAIYVWLAALPLMPNGKLDRKMLPAGASRADDRVAVAPRNRHELQLARIWQSLFDLEGLSIDDNFFELGGHSLLAVQLAAKIEADLGKRLPLAALFKAPTIEQLARLIAEDTTDEMWEPLVPLRTGGFGPTLFCVPGAGGQCHYLYHLAAVLGSEHPVYAFQAKGMDGRSAPHASIDEMAAYYVELLLETQPEGPYYLAGHSFGGSVAFEMGRRLEASGREVKFVALLDAGMPSGTDASDAALNVLSLRALGHVYGREIVIDEVILAGLSNEEQLHLIKPYLVELGVVHEEAGIVMVRGLMNIFKTQLRMAYQPDGGQVEQLLFIQARERFDTAELPALESALEKWMRLSKRPLVHTTAPGDHISLLNRENAYAVAEILRAWMVPEPRVVMSGMRN